ncbi:carbohydrate binding protein with CBM6 domain [Mucilaginibacter oryzae]|uniref:Carbohydrate binding protein with CBM6 domain n=1 Tax=Mucilaginibacter oryzae TaxID=468058 RepID=A0A316H6F5_9SPHI|nr:cellulase family glycosylhydrolase [Mucilaginibacter oryzae]PWK72478.1 carbohydrate binding protein with CBM6 domain [Mucilaginibacter oryzae]
MLTTFRKNIKLSAAVKVLLAAAPTLFFSLTGNAQTGFLKAEGKKIVDEKGQNVLLRGMGLGGWMLQEGYMLHINKDSRQYRIRERLEELMGPAETKEFYDTWLANNTRKIDVDSMKRWGFNSVRLPMHYNLYTLPVDKEPVAGKNTWIEKGFKMTDDLLAWCKANHMYLILDLHATPGGQGNDLNISDRDPDKPSLWDSEANKAKTIALWRKLAERYKNEPYIGAYDIINEPNWGFDDPRNDKNGLKEKTNAPLRKLMVDITAAIREVDKKHIIIIEGNGWGNNYNGILPQWDKNMVLSFHKYWNFNDQKSIEHIVKTRDQYNIPVWLGETGENSNTWITEAIGLLERNNIGWSLWPLKKLGNNNPLEIVSNLNYDDVAGYMNTGRHKPKESNVYSGTLELATYAKLESNIIHHDVIDAIFRQPHSADTKPFKANKIGNGTIINAVDYDLGRNGSAYFDTDTADYHTSGKPGVGNRGHVYRNDGVDIAKDSTQYNSYYVDHIETGEWTQYTVFVKTPGVYSISLKVASPNDDAKLSVLVDNTTQAKEVAVPNTGGLKKWQVIAVKNIVLKAGANKIKVQADNGRYNLHYLQFWKGK